jgi:hypothetical protein
MALVENVKPNIKAGLIDPAMNRPCDESTLRRIDPAMIYESTYDESTHDYLTHDELTRDELTLH